MADSDDLAKGAAGGLIAALLLGATRKDPTNGKDGKTGAQGPRGPGISLVGSTQVQWQSPNVVSPVSRLVNTIEAPVNVPPGTTHLCGMIIFQQQNSPQLEILNISNGILFLPYSGPTVQPQVQWRMENLAPLAGGETTVDALLVFLRVDP